MNKFINFKKLNWVCHHLHIDKSNTVTKNLLKESQVHMKEKWILMNDIKNNYTENSLRENMLNTTTNLVNQGCNHMRTFVDIDNIVKLEPLNHALNLQNYWKKKMSYN